MDNHMHNHRNQEALETEFNQFFGSRSHEFYGSSIYKLVSCWEKITDCDGDYFSE
jgi:hypothetical protein